MPDVGKSITAYYDLDFYEKFRKSDFAQPCDFVYVGFLETLLKDLTSLQYKLRKICVIMKEFWPRAFLSPYISERNLHNYIMYQAL